MMAQFVHCQLRQKLLTEWHLANGITSFLIAVFVDPQSVLVHMVWCIRLDLWFGGQLAVLPVLNQLIAIACFGFNPGGQEFRQQRGFVFLVLWENIFDCLHHFPLSMETEFAQLRNIILGLQQVLEIIITFIRRQFVGDNQLLLADLRKVFVAQKMDGEAHSRGAIFKQGGAAGIHSIGGGFRRCAGNHVPGALVFGQFVAIAPG